MIKMLTHIVGMTEWEKGEKSNMKVLQMSFQNIPDKNIISISIYLHETV